MFLVHKRGQTDGRERASFHLVRNGRSACARRAGLHTRPRDSVCVCVCVRLRAASCVTGKIHAKTFWQSWRADPRIMPATRRRPPPTPTPQGSIYSHHPDPHRLELARAHVPGPEQVPGGAAAVCLARQHWPNTSSRCKTRPEYRLETFREFLHSAIGHAPSQLFAG